MKHIKTHLHDDTQDRWDISRRWDNTILVPFWVPLIGTNTDARMNDFNAYEDDITRYVEDYVLEPLGDLALLKKVELNWEAQDEKSSN